MWPWRSRPERPAAGLDRTESDGSGPDAGRSGGSVAAVAAEPPGAWQRAAPMRPVIAQHPLVNPVQRFSSTLAAWQDPRSLAPLSHVVGADEPSGLISMATAPAPEHPDSAPDLPVAAAPAPTSAWAAPGRLLAAMVQRLVNTPPPAGTPAPIRPETPPWSPAGSASDPGGRVTGPAAGPGPTVVQRTPHSAASPGGGPGGSAGSGGIGVSRGIAVLPGGLAATDAAGSGGTVDPGVHRGVEAATSAPASPSADAFPGRGVSGDAGLPVQPAIPVQRSAVPSASSAQAPSAQAPSAQAPSARVPSRAVPGAAEPPEPAATAPPGDLAGDASGAGGLPAAAPVTVPPDAPMAADDAGTMMAADDPVAGTAVPGDRAAGSVGAPADVPLLGTVDEPAAVQRSSAAERAPGPGWMVAPGRPGGPVAGSAHQPAGQRSVAPTGAPMERSGGPVPAPPADVQRDMSPAVAPPGGAASPSRRLGLGAPIVPDPAGSPPPTGTAPVQRATPHRSTGAAPADRWGPPEPRSSVPPGPVAGVAPVQRSGAGQAGASTGTSGAVPPASPVPAGDLPVQRLLADGGAASPPTGSRSTGSVPTGSGSDIAAPSHPPTEPAVASRAAPDAAVAFVGTPAQAAPPAVQRAAVEGPALIVARLLGERPLSVVGVPDGAGPPPSGAGAAPVTVSRWPVPANQVPHPVPNGPGSGAGWPADGANGWTADGGGGGWTADGGAGSTADDVSGWTADGGSANGWGAGGMTGSFAGASAAAPVAWSGSPRVQRSTAGGPAGAAADRAGHAPQAQPRPVDTPTYQGLSVLPVAGSRGASPVDTGSWAAGSTAPAPSVGTVQRQDQPITEPVPEPVPEPAPVAVPAAPVADAGPPPAAAAPAAPEELLATLFDPLLRRLKAELRIDRDRRGSLTDLRR